MSAPVSLWTFLRRWRCRLLSHRIIDIPWIYEQGRTMAFVGGVEQEIGITWGCCEECSRCGLRIWTPW